MQQSAKQAKGEGRCKRKENDRVFKRKKRNTYVHYSPEQVADIFRLCPRVHEPCRLLPSPSTFVRLMARTFHSEFPGFMSAPAFVAAVLAETPAAAAAAAPQPASVAAVLAETPAAAAAAAPQPASVAAS